MRELKVVLIGALMMALLLLSACGGSATLVFIDDDGLTTELETALPKRVDKLLEEAQITLGENDRVEPSLDTKLQEGENIIVEREHRIKIVLGEETREALIVGGTVKDLIDQEGIKLREDQFISLPMDQPLTKGMEVEIFDKLQVTVNVDDKSEKGKVKAETVEEALAELGVKLGEADRVEPEMTSEVTEGMAITVKRVTTEEVTEVKAVDFETSYEYTEAYLKGVEVVSREGKAGEKTETYKVTLVDGKEESRELVGETITRQPVTAIIIVGTYQVPEYMAGWGYYGAPDTSAAAENMATDSTVPTDSTTPSTPTDSTTPSNQDNTATASTPTDSTAPSNKDNTATPSTPTDSTTPNNTATPTTPTDSTTQTTPTNPNLPQGVYEVSREDYPNCSGDGHGYWHIVYSDGSEAYIEY